jgi:hypothetical protein
MKTTELIKKLSKSLGKQWKPAAAPLAPDHKAPVLPLLDKLGVIQLHENWRN